MNTDARVRLHTGRSMPVLGLGTWQLNDDTAGTVDEALRQGSRMIDTSGDYGTQPGVGEAMRRTDLDRDQIYLVTKVEEDEDAYEATRRNLDELGLEQADLMLIHRPPPSGAGEDLWRGLIRARDEGLARDIGVSNYSVEQIEELVRATGETPAVNQVEWSPFDWSRDLLDWSTERGIVIQAYSPLTRGKRLGDERLVALAERHGRTPAQVLIRWNLQLGVVPLPKANRRDHAVENLAVFDFELTDADIDELDCLNRHASSLGSLPYV
ncbi:MAG: aldo/keto reductase [Candidatus Limnocylindria bacterium]